MENKIYYGEYSLAYWIELILSEKIILPKYQRHFVWSEERLKLFINTLKEKRFVPPITIGLFKDGSKQVHYIIDGQQRLTCILLAYLGYFPNKEKFKSMIPVYAGNDFVELEEEGIDTILEWNFRYLTTLGIQKNNIISKLDATYYKSLVLDVSEDFWNNTFLGFSYVVPKVTSTEEQQQYYTKVFREINLQGVSLLSLESRRSLYFLNENLEQYFDPHFAKQYFVKLVGEIQNMDFVRYLSLLASYNKYGNSNKVARGYGYRLEEYYETYIYSVVEDYDSILFGKFDEIFQQRNYNDDMKYLAQMLVELNIPQQYPSIINMDMYFFGLIYWTLFKHKKIDSTRKELLHNAIEKQIMQFKTDGTKHIHAPAQFRFMRSRIDQSIKIYKQYLQQ